MIPTSSFSAWAVIEVVGNHLWQSTLFAAVAGLLTLALRNNRAQVRYWLWLTASVKFLIPFAALVAIGNQLSWRSSATIAQPEMTFLIDTISQPFSRAELRVTGAASPAAAFSSVVGAVPVLVIAIWFCGCALILAAWWMRWQRVAAAVRQGWPVKDGREVDTLRRVEQSCGLKRPIALISSKTTLEPGVFGILQPVLLWPRGIGDRLADSQVEAIVAHEVWHVRRRDNLAAAVQMFVEAVFWFHPLVWWVGARLVDERERACDEEVLRLGSEPQVYAESILKTCEFCVESPLVCMAGVTGSSLKKRIEAIMTNHIKHRLNVTKKLLLGSAGVAAVTLPVVVGLMNAPHIQAESPVAQSQSVEPPEALKIEVASIKRNISDEPGPQFRAQSGGISVRGITAKLLLEIAYGVQNFQISGDPSWAGKERFDIVAKIEGVTGTLPMGSMPRVFLSLLADRFHLEAHREMKEGPIYALMPASRGHKLQTVAGVRPYSASATRGYVSGTMDITTLANWLAWRLERPVVDKTGMPGAYDIELIWTPDVGQAVGSALPPPAPPLAPPAPPAPGDRPLLPMRRPPAPDPSGPSLFTALQEQLGLRLESERAPVEILVIDRLERPSEN